MGSPAACPNPTRPSTIPPLSAGNWKLPLSLAVQVAARSDIGCVRLNNEDNYGYDADCGIYVVCDGMGGQAAGEVASKIGVDTILGYFREGEKTGQYPVPGQPFEGVSARANVLGQSIRRANQAIHDSARGDPERAGMGSTVVAALVEDGFFSIGHAGDSRIYLLRQGAIQQLTRDHSLVMEQVRRGLLTPEQARASDMQNIIIRALGADETVEPDLDDQAAQEGDILLLCSDGLTRHVPDESICDLVTGVAALPLAVGSLIEAARGAGGSDNITCMLLKFVKQPWYRQYRHRPPRWSTPA